MDGVSVRNAATITLLFDCSFNRKVVVDSDWSFYLYTNKCIHLSLVMSVTVTHKKPLHLPALRQIRAQMLTRQFYV